MKTLLMLFISFFQVGLFSVGGGYAAIPLIQNQVVDINHFLTLEEFTDLITIAEMTPGSIAINSATFVGTRVAGTLGAVVCTVGCITPSFIICLILAFFYYKYRNFSGVKTVLSAMRPAVVALIASAGISILMLGLFNSKSVSFSNLRIVELILFGACLFILRKWKTSAVLMILGSGVVGTIIYFVLGLA